jgi:MoaA/NifB/PqqE/SkfB family radical SAM enzyme
MSYDAVRTRRDPLPHLQQHFPQGLQEIIENRRPAGPLHVEIHPHHQTTPFCNNNCAGCTGSHYRSLPSAGNVGIDPERLLCTIGSFNSTSVREVVFSGNCTEPLLYPEIVPAITACRAAGLRFSLYSNFYYGDSDVIDALTSQDAVNDYVRISLDAGSATSYEKTHSPRQTDAYMKILSNIERLLKAKRRNRPRLFVHITYLLNNHNAADEELTDAVRWAAGHEGVNCMRFTTYQKPLGRKMDDASYLLPDDMERISSTLAALKERYDRKEDPAGREDFIVMPMLDEMEREQKQKTFRQCYVQDIFAVIGFDGGIYPCTAMAYPETPAYMRFGNINTDDFWDIWRTRKNHFRLDRCYDCTRAEQHINEAIERKKTNITRTIT